MSRQPQDPQEPRTLLKGRTLTPQAQGVRITVLGGPASGTGATITQRTAIVGRSPTADFQINDPTVSSFHVELSGVAGGIAVVDLKSLNGTHHAGASLERAVVPSGAMLEIGGSLMRVESDEQFQPPALDASSFGELRGRSIMMRELFLTLSRLARTELSVLIEGATGTGKELAARAIHNASQFASGPFVVLDCTAIPSSLAESVLFGHERGAFTGANEQHAGIFESAEGGTVFLDEVGELPAELQPKLLRVLERHEVMRVGSTQPRAIRVRVLCATWRDLRAMVNQAKFREDLYYRIAQARIPLPPLRERPEDIGLLVHHFLQALPATVQAARSIDPNALEELCRRDYPGNVRELKSMVERAALMAEGSVITLADLAFERILTGGRGRAPMASSNPSPSIPPPGSSEALTPFKDAKRSLIDEFEKNYLARLLERTSGNLTRAASLAGIERHYLRDLFRKHGLRSTEA